MACLPENVVRLREYLVSCTLCPRCCRVNRLAGEIGACGVGDKAIVASAGPHFGEEPVLTGAGGSGTIFFSGCNLHCVFCQNFNISQSINGQKLSAKQIAEQALSLERSGCVNVNFVTPTHVAHAVAEAIFLARSAGLRAPVVYNCGGYESLQTLRLLAGAVQIYMPDFKYASGAAGRRYSDVDDYPAAARTALAEMYRQVGPLQLDKSGVATQGVLVRHLVLPNNLARSREVIDIVAAEAPGCAINVMGQYHPAHRANKFPELSARPAADEIVSLRQHAAECGLRLVH